MNTRLAIASIIVSDPEQAEPINALLHQYRQMVRARLGLPYPQRDVQVISVVLDGAQDDISALSGKLGKLRGVTSKVMFAPEQ